MTSFNIDNIEDYQTKVSQSAIVVFGAKWCANCTVLSAAIADQLGQDHQLLAPVPLYKVDIDDAAELAEHAAISKLPHTVFAVHGKTSSYTGSDIQEFIRVYRSLLSGDNDNNNDNTMAAAVQDPSSCEPVIPPITQINHTTANADLPQKCVPASFGSITWPLLVQVGLGDLPITASMMADLNDSVAIVNSTAAPVAPANLDDLYVYRIPTVSKDGTCSNVHVLAKDPFNLAVNAYGLSELYYSNLPALRSHPVTERLVRLNQVVSAIHELTGADWIGLYRVVNADGSTTLLKEAYRGEPSRPLFPVTAGFAKKSTNSWVALEGKTRIIRDTHYREPGVSYYECSGKVRSELCVPVLRRLPGAGDDAEARYQVIGIIDLESWNVDHFHSRMVLEVFKVALDLGGADFLV